MQDSTANAPASCRYLFEVGSSSRRREFSLALRSRESEGRVKLLERKEWTRVITFSTSSSNQSAIVIQLLFNQILNMEKHNHLGERIKTFEEALTRRQEGKKQAKQKRAEVLAQLQEDYEQRSNSMISKMEELKRKETLLITLKKIEPEVPESFPKNYFCQLVYEDTLLTGSQKFTDFDQNVVQEKFVVPLLFANILKVEVWSAEEEPVLWTRTEIDLQKDIEAALISQACEGSLPLGDTEATLSYRLQLQGIGFSTWLKNVVEMRELEAEKAYSREQASLRKEQMRARVQQKKAKFNEKFSRSDKKSTNEYKVENMDKLLEDLKLD